VPAIYDDDGEPVWIADNLGNSIATASFGPQTVNGVDRLVYYFGDVESDNGKVHVLDSAYELVETISDKANASDGHEVCFLSPFSCTLFSRPRNRPTFCQMAMCSSSRLITTGMV
jgi:hypothetical protein